MDGNRTRPNHLGINKISKNIRKSPLHQPTSSNPKQQQQQHSHGGGGGGNQQQQPQPQVYNISKSDFRSMVQQLTGTPTRDPSPSYNPPPPAHNPPKAPSVRLQKIRPPPLAPIARPPIPHPNTHRLPHPANPNFYARPLPAPAAAPALSPNIPFSPLLPLTPPPGSTVWGNTLESPVSAFMRSLESSIENTDGSRQVLQQFQQPQQAPSRLPPPGQMPPMLLPPPQAAPQSRPPLQEGQNQVTGSATSSNNPGLLPNPYVAAPGPSPLPSPGLLPSPTSPFILPSPSAFLNLMSPRSPFPLLSPRFQYPPLTPNHAFSPMGGQSSLLGPGPQPSSSPGLMFPPSPSSFFPITSPRWRNL